MSSDDVTALVDVVMAWATAWEQRSAARIIALWDVSDTASWYLPAGSAEPSLGSAVVGLIQRRCLNAAEIGYRAHHLQCRRLAPDVGLVFFELTRSERPVGQHHDQPHPIGDQVRVTMVMRQSEKGWRIFHYAEAPLAPLLELQAYYEDIAIEGLNNISQRSFVGPVTP